MKNVTKKFLAMLMALALLVTVVPATRTEAATTLSDGTYTVTANLYVPSTSNPVNKLWNAYFTTTKMPPNSAGSANATMVVANGKATVTVPLINSGLSLLTLETSSSSITPVLPPENYTCDGGHTFSRIKSLTYTIDADDATGTVQYQFGQSTIHAQIDIFSIAIHDSDETVGSVYLDVNYASAKAQ